MSHRLSFARRRGDRLRLRLLLPQLDKLPQVLIALLPLHLEARFSRRERRHQLLRARACRLVGGFEAITLRTEDFHLLTEVALAGALPARLLHLPDQALTARLGLGGLGLGLGQLRLGLGQPRRHLGQLRLRSSRPRLGRPHALLRLAHLLTCHPQLLA